MNSKKLIFMAIACNSIAALATSAAPTEALAFQQFQAGQIAALTQSTDSEVIEFSAHDSLISVRALLLNLGAVTDPGKEPALKRLRKELQSLLQLAEKQMKDNSASPRDEIEQKARSSQSFCAAKSIEPLPITPAICTKLLGTCPFTQRTIEAEINNDSLTVQVFVRLEDSSNPPRNPDVSLVPEPELFATAMTIELPKTKKYQLSYIDVHRNNVFSIYLKEAGKAKEKRMTFMTAHNHPVYRYCGAHDGYMKLYFNDLDTGKNEEAGWGCAIM